MLYFAPDCVYVFKTRTAKHKRASQVSVVFHDEFVHVVLCQSIKCKTQNHWYCASRAKLFTSSDIELNPGPVVILREIIQTILLHCYNFD